MAASVVSLGDLFRILSVQINDDVVRTVNNFVDQHPERNTLDLQALVLRSRRKMLQILAIIRWLKSPRTLKMFQCVDECNQNLQSLQAQRTVLLDRCFILHRNMFFMRCPQHLSAHAFEIMTQQRVKQAVPSSVIDIQSRAIIDKASSTLKQSTMDNIVQLRILMRKEAEVLRNPMFNFNEVGGILHIELPHLFSSALVPELSKGIALWRLLSYETKLWSSAVDERGRVTNNVDDNFLSDLNNSRIPNLAVFLQRSCFHSLSHRLRDICEALTIKDRNEQGPVFLSSNVSVSSSRASCSFGCWRRDLTREPHFVFSVSIEMSEDICVCRWTVSVASSETNFLNPDADVRQLLEIKSLNTLQATLLSPLLHQKLRFLYSRVPAVSAVTGVTFTLTDSAVEVTCRDNVIFIFVDQATGKFFLNHALALDKIDEENIIKFLQEVNSPESEVEFAAFFVDNYEHGKQQRVFREWSTSHGLAALLMSAVARAQFFNSGYTFPSTSDREARFLSQLYQQQALSSSFRRVRFWEDMHKIDSGRRARASAAKRPRREITAAVKVLYVLYVGITITPDLSRQMSVVLCSVSLDALSLPLHMHRIRDWIHPIAKHSASLSASLMDIREVVSLFRQVSSPRVALTGDNFCESLFQQIVDETGDGEDCALWKRDKEYTVVVICPSGRFSCSFGTASGISSILSPSQTMRFQEQSGTTELHTFLTASLRLSSHAQYQCPITVDNVQILRSLSRSGADSSAESKIGDMDSVLKRILKQLLEHFCCSSNDVVPEQSLQLAVLSFRALALFFLIINTDFAHIKSSWFTQQDIQLAGCSITKRAISLSVRVEIPSDTAADGRNCHVPNFIRVVLPLTEPRTTLPKLQCTELRTMRSLQLNVEDVTLMTVADFYNAPFEEES